MKKTTILVVLMLVAFGMQAQDNIVKLGLGSAINRTINLEYERVLTEKTSVLAELGFGLGASIGDQTISATGIEGGENGIAISSGKYNSFYFVAEYRYYTKGEGPKGFYVAPYLKFSNYSLDFEGTYNNSTNGFTDIPSEINTGMFVAAVGGTIGYQWIVNDKVAINWNIIGLGGSINTISAGFTSSDEDVFASWEQDVREFLDEVPSGSNIEITSDNETKTIDGSGSFGFLNLRLGLSIGYKF
jgi:hypothetical protein